MFFVISLFISPSLFRYVAFVVSLFQYVAFVFSLSSFRYFVMAPSLCSREITKRRNGTNQPPYFTEMTISIHLLHWMDVILDCICTDFTELWGTWRQRKMKNKTLCLQWVSNQTRHGQRKVILKLMFQEICMHWRFICHFRNPCCSASTKCVTYCNNNRRIRSQRYSRYTAVI